MHCKLARFLNQSGNTKDALHQLRLAMQLAPNDCYLLEVHQQFCRKLELNANSLPTVNTNNAKMIAPDLTENWALNYWFKTPEIIPLKK